MYIHNIQNVEVNVNINEAKKHICQTFSFRCFVKEKEHQKENLTQRFETENRQELKAAFE